MIVMKEKVFLHHRVAKLDIESFYFHHYTAQRGESLITMYKTRSNLLCIYISESLLPVYHWLRKGIVIKLETQLWCSDSNIVNTVSLVIIVDYIMIKTRDFVAQCKIINKQILIWDDVVNFSNSNFFNGWHPWMIVLTIR